MSGKLELASAIAASALPFAGSILASSGYDSGKAIAEWYDKLKAPTLKPPNWVFAPVWSYLYTSSGYASYLVWNTGGGFRGIAQGPLLLYGATLLLNWAFSPIYFGRRDVKMGFVVSVPLMVSVYTCGFAFMNINRTAGLLFIPYALWCTFATFLSYKFWKLNPKETVAERSKAIKNQ